MPESDPTGEANTYAVALVRAGKYEAAATVLRRALGISPRSHELWSNLGSAFWSMRRYDDALGALENALRLKRDYPMAHANIGLVHEGLRNYELADHHFAEAIRADPDYLDARWDRALLWLARGDFARGLPEYETRIERKRGTAYPVFASPMWQGEDLAGKTILVEPEQGFGDTILFSRFLPLIAAKAGKVYFCASPKLLPLLWGYREFVEFLPVGVPLPTADYHVFIGSLPRWLISSPEEIPPDPGVIRATVERHQAPHRLELPQPSTSPALKVGICWTGNPAQERNDERSIPFPLLMSLAADPRVWLYSLQMGPASAEIDAAGAGGIVQNLDAEMQAKGLVGTGSAMLQLDLVVTCCTSIAHLAGALNVPCWIPVCVDPYWIWGYGEGVATPWYPSVRLFRQQKPGHWEPVIELVLEAIVAFLDQPTEDDKLLSTGTLYSPAEISNKRILEGPLLNG